MKAMMMIFLDDDVDKITWRGRDGKDAEL